MSRQSKFGKGFKPTSLPVGESSALPVPGSFKPDQLVADTGAPLTDDQLVAGPSHVTSQPATAPMSQLSYPALLQNLERLLNSNNRTSTFPWERR
ncbi:hypothetical protein MMC14_009181 [Varicellaria rhodocarpa]|nr:hypothetical protein [Varicellaria rhodocarpa]